MAESQIAEHTQGTEDDGQPPRGFPHRIAIIGADGNVHSAAGDNAGNLGVSVTAGGLVVLGTTADAAVQGDNPGTLSAKLRGMNRFLGSSGAAILNDTFDTSAVAVPTIGVVLTALSQGGNLAARVKMHDGSADGRVTSIAGLATEQYGLRYNETTWDRERGNREFSILPSAARTVTTTSADFTNYNSRGIIIGLNVTVASGTGGLQVGLFLKDFITGGYKQLNTAPTAIVATGLFVYEFYPGASATGNLNQTNTVALPRTWRIGVAVGDATSYTYSVSGSETV